MSLATFKTALLAKYPDVFVRDTPDFCTSPNMLYIAGEPQGGGKVDYDAEGNQLFNYYADGRLEGKLYFFGVHKEVNDLASMHGVWLEWLTAGSLGVYPA